MRATRLQTPHAMKTTSASMPAVVRTRRMRPFSTSSPVTSAFTVERPPCSCAYSRISVPARSGSTTETPGVYQPPRITSGFTNGTRSTTPSGVSSSVPGSPHEVAEETRRFSSSSRSCAGDLDAAADRQHAELLVLTRAVLRQAVISFEWSTGKMKLRRGPSSRRGSAAVPSRRAQVAPAEPREVIDKAVTDDPAPITTARAELEARHG